MRALFVEPDPVIRGHLHCLAQMAGLDHTLVADAAEAFAVLEGRPARSRQPWQLSSSKQRSEIGFVATETNLPDMDGEEFLFSLHLQYPAIQLLAYTETFPTFDLPLPVARIDKPGNADLVVWRALAAIGKEDRVFRAMICAA